jgi:hypothetical protein
MFSKTVGQLPKTQIDYIKSEIRKDVNGTDDLGYAIFHGVAGCWDLWKFENKRQCEIAHLEYKIACQIRTYCRRNKVTTRKGSYHSFDCRYEHQQLWSMVSAGGQDGQADNVRWCYRTVDGLKNLYIWFK